MMRSTGTGVSPRARSESAVSYPRPPRICTVSSMMRQPASELYSLAIAASRRMSYPPRSAIAPHSSATASIARVFAAMEPSFCAIASCWPIGRPHCTRSAAQRRAISRQRFPAATEEIGNVSRPVFSVMSASFNPLPSPHSTFSLGTRTLVKRITPL